MERRQQQPQPQAQPQPVPQSRPVNATGATEQRRTTVEEGTEIKGQLTSKCPLVVKGQVEGEITAPSITIDASGSLRGTALAQEISSQGFLSGNFEAERVILGGKVGDKTVIKARTLEAKLATEGQTGLQVTFGECRLEIGDDPSAKPVAPAAKEKPQNAK
jgi:cytoskeletal protein CcmA (bactofilin family)